MSIAVMSHVWEHSQHSEGTLLVLLALADYANDKGQSWPSVGSLARKARLSERQTRYVLRKLEETGEIKTAVKAGPKGSNLYQIAMVGAETAPPRRGSLAQQVGQLEVMGGGNLAQVMGQSTAPESVIEPSIEPSEEPLRPNGRTRPRDPLFDAIAEVCQVDPATAGATIGKVKAVLSKAGYSPEEVKAFGVLWWGAGFRKVPPTPWQVQGGIGNVRGGGMPRPEPKGMAAIRAYEEEQRGRQ